MYATSLYWLPWSVRWPIEFQRIATRLWVRSSARSLHHSINFLCTIVHVCIQSKNNVLVYVGKLYLSQPSNLCAMNKERLLGYYFQIYVMSCSFFYSDWWFAIVILCKQFKLIDSRRIEFLSSINISILWIAL